MSTYYSIITLACLLCLPGHSKPDLIMVPKVAEVGSAVVMTCTNLTMECPSGNVSLTRNENNNTIGREIISSQRIGEDLVTTIRATEPQKRYYSCLCKKDNSHRVTGLDYFEALYRPAKAANFSCHSPGFEELICSWDHRSDPWSETTWNVTFSAFRRDRDEIIKSLKEYLENKTCVPDTSPRTCRIDSASTMRYKLYRFRVLATNPIGQASATFETYTGDSIVKPPPVRNLTLQAVNGNSTTLAWAVGGGSAMISVIELRGLEYKVRYNEQGQSNVKHLIFTSKRMHEKATLVDLKPFKQYKVTVQCRVAEKGQFWSDLSAILFRTPETVPQHAPAVQSKNGFSYSDSMQCEGDSHGMTLYWQGIPEISGAGNGIITSYSIFGDFSLVANISASAREVSFCLHANRSHIFKLFGATKVGMAKESSEIHVTKYSAAAGYRIKSCDISAQIINETVLEIFLDQRSAAYETVDRSSGVQSPYTAFWCQAHRSNCKNDVYWMDIDAKDKSALNQTVTSFRMRFIGDAETYKFGMSRSGAGGISSGITWADCIHSQNGPSTKTLPPRVTTLNGGHRVAKVTRAPCYSGSSRTVSRRLHWCRVTDSITDNCETVKAEQSPCCQAGTHQSREIGPCDYEGTIQSRDGHDLALWITSYYSNGDLVVSTVVTSNASSEHHAESGWSGAMVGGTVLGGASFLCILVTLLILIRSYLRTTSMDIKKIRKVPTVTEEMLVDEYDEKPIAYRSNYDLYMKNPTKPREREVRVAAKGCPEQAWDHLVETLGGCDRADRWVPGALDDCSNSVITFNNGNTFDATIDNVSCTQTWGDFREDDDMALPDRWSSCGITTNGRTGAGLGFDVSTADIQLQLQDWLPAHFYVESRSPRAVSKPSKAADGILSHRAPERMGGDSALGGRPAHRAAAPLVSRASYPMLAAIDGARSDESDPLGGSSQITTSSSCSSLGYWKVEPGGAEQLRKASSAAATTALPREMSAAPSGSETYGAGSFRRGATEDGYYVRAYWPPGSHQTSGARPTASLGGAANARSCLDYI